MVRNKKSPETDGAGMNEFSQCKNKFFNTGQRYTI